MLKKRVYFSCSEGKIVICFWPGKYPEAQKPRQRVSVANQKIFARPNGFNSVRTVLILSGQFSILSGQFSILSRQFQFCLDGFNTVARGCRVFLIVARKDHAFFDVAREGYALLLYVAKKGAARFVRKFFARKKPLSGKF